MSQIILSVTSHPGMFDLLKEMERNGKNLQVNSSLNNLVFYLVDKGLTGGRNFTAFVLGFFENDS